MLSAADLVLTNGRIVTVDGAFSIATSMAIKAGKIEAVGGDAISSLVGPDTKVIDLKGRCVVPGLVDGYSHIITSGLDLIGAAGKVNIMTSRSIAGILDAVAARVRTTPPGQWVATSCMYRGELTDGRWPNRSDLDSVSPENPVYIMQGGRPIIANSAALRLAGIDRDTKNPDRPAGIIVRDEKGEPTGQLIAGAADMARQRWAKQAGLRPEEWDFQHTSQQELAQACLAQQKVFHACGVTATRDVATVRKEIGAFVDLRRAGLLKLRTRLMIIVPERYLQTEADFAEVFESYFQPWEMGGDRLGVAGVAIDYSLDGWHMIDKPMLTRLVVESNKRGWTIAVTPGTGGEAEVDDVLDALEAADRDHPLAGRRLPIMHPMGLRRADQRQRAKRLGLTLNPNPLLNYTAAGRSMRMYDAIAKSGLLRSAAKDGFSQAVEMWGAPVKDWIDDGFIVSAGSNTPAAVYDPEAPFRGPHALCTGETLAGVLMPGQSIGRDDMLRVYTINGAYAMGLENEIGSLEAGKAADFIVLDHDILACDDNDLAKTKVLMSFFAGECVYERA